LWIDLFFDSDCGQGSSSSTTAYCGTAAGGAVADFTNDPARVDQFTQAWLFLVDRYKDQPFIGMYEILPEPSFGCKSKKSCVSWAAAPDFYKPIIDKIRAKDSTTPILIGANGGYSPDQIATAYIPGETGIIYTADFLNDNAQHPELLPTLTMFRDTQNVPLFIQQVGVRQDTADAGPLATTILSDLNADDIGWVWWTYREQKQKTPVGYAPFYQDNGGPWGESQAWLTLITSEFH
jgi:hypothetical protein